MKKLFILVFSLVCFTVFSIPIDPTLARVKLTTSEVITQRQFRDKIEILENSYQRSTTEDERRQVLDSLIDEILVVQAADRDGILVSTSEVNESIEQYKTELAMQLGMNRPLTEDELKNIITQQESTWDEFLEQIEKKVKIEKYIQQEKGGIFDTIAEPGTDEIEDFYESNKMQFISPDIIKIKQIMIVTKGLDTSKTQMAEAKANDIYRQIQSGTSFDRFLEIYLDDTNKTKVGGLSFDIWLRDDQGTEQGYGTTFFNTVFKMSEGDRSALLKSNIGYHIVEIIEKIPLKILSLDDDVPPQNNFTVREYIGNYLMNMKAQELFQQVTEELIGEVRAQSEVQVFEQYLTW
jgi:parvulin-like peptidyl-prolyl isomerase